MAQPRPQSRNKLHSALLDIHREIWVGGKTLEEISVVQYSRKYKMRNFGKACIAEMMSRPTEPTIDDATELARVLSYNAHYVRAGKRQRWKRAGNQAPSVPDWEQRRYEIAKDILATMFFQPENLSLTVEADVDFAVEVADILIEKLKKGE